MFLSPFTGTLLKKMFNIDNLKSRSFLKNTENYRSGKVGPGDILWNTLTVSIGYEANATGVPPYVNTSDPFTWCNHNKLFGKISHKKSSHPAYRYQFLMISSIRGNAPTFSLLCILGSQICCMYAK